MGPVLGGHQGALEKAPVERAQHQGTGTTLANPVLTSVKSMNPACEFSSEIIIKRAQQENKPFVFLLKAIFRLS